MKAFIAAISTFALATSLWAGEGDTSVWKNFEMIASRGALNTGSMRINIPGGNGSLADMLSRGSALFVKYYGPGSLASTSMRGMGAQHTAVMWNGVNLQSAMNSNFDLNLIPSFFIDNASLETGANAASCGNGAIGGAIVLSHTLPSEKRIFGEGGYGSFSQGNAGAGVSYFRGPFTLRTRLTYRSAENDYPYRDYFTAGSPEQRMKNSRFEQKGILQELQYRAGKGHTFYGNACFLSTRRQLPPVMGAALLFNERQNDGNAMLLLRHQMEAGKRTTLTNRIFWLKEQIDYFNDMLAPAHNRSSTLQAESALRLLDGKSEWNFSLQAIRQYAVTDGYTTGRKRDMFSVYTGYRWKGAGKPGPKSRGLVFSAGNRLLMAEGNIVVPTPELGAEYRVSNRIQFKSNAAASYRIPSFNDLYWKPGGNPDLRPEKGLKGEISAEYRTSGLKTGLTVFRHRVEDWIMWLPLKGASGWSAVNAKQVDSRGLEFSADLKYTLGKSTLRLFGRYQYVESVNTKVYEDDRSLQGKQLLYTPLHTGFAGFHYMFGKFRLHTGMQVNGSRFATADNSPEHQLPGFVLFNASVSFEFRTGGNTSNMEAGIGNLGNRAYEVFEFRPMPLRHYYLTYKFNIHYE